MESRKYYGTNALWDKNGNSQYMRSRENNFKKKFSTLGTFFEWESADKQLNADHWKPFLWTNLCLFTEVLAYQRETNSKHSFQSSIRQIIKEKFSGIFIYSYNLPIHWKKRCRRMVLFSRAVKMTKFQETCKNVTKSG